MSNIRPPWFNLSGDNLEPGESVLPVGKHTCPFCQPESEGGDPAGWSVAVTHADLITWNQDNPITFGITGTWEIDLDRVQITEGGSAAGCAYRITLSTGRNGTLNFDFSAVVTPEGQGCLPIVQKKQGYGQIGDSGGAFDDQETTLNITNNQTGVAICSSSCTAGELGAFNLDSVGTLTGDLVLGWEEKVCRAADGTYRYTFTGVATVFCSEGGVVKAYLFTGDWDEDRFIGEPVPTDPEYTLSGSTVVGSVRGAAINCRYVTYEEDHANSNVTGAPGNCPTPSYSSDVTTGETTGTIAVTIGG